MIDFVALPLVVTMLVVLFGSRMLDQVGPAAAARCSAVLLTAVAIAAVPTLWLIGLSGLAHAGLHNPITDWSQHLVPSNQPLGAVIGIAALGVAAVGSLRAGRVVWMHRRVRCADTDPVEFIDTDDVYAYTLPGPAATIAISTGLCNALDNTEFAIVLAHERAHARHRHDRFKLLGLVCAAFVPLLRPMVTRLDFYLERWADEESLVATGADRRVAARTIAKVALTGAAHALVLGIGNHGVAARADALLVPIEPPARSTWVKAVALIATSVGLAAYQLHHTATFATALAH